MSQDNLEIFRRAIDALNARDFDTIAQLAHEDGEWRPALTAGGDLEHPVYRGLAGMRQYADDMDDLFVDTRFEVERLDLVDPDRIFFYGRVTARGRGSGVPVDVPVWALWELRDGKLLRGTAYLAEAKALEALGRLE